eukprot:1027742-Prorocentrum_minimum.AAC.1
MRRGGWSVHYRRAKGSTPPWSSCEARSSTAERQNIRGRVELVKSVKQRMKGLIREFDRGSSIGPGPIQNCNGGPSTQIGPKYVDGPPLQFFLPRETSFRCEISLRS